MSKEIVVRQRCDVCGVDDIAKPGMSVREVAWSWDGKQYGIGVCDTCDVQAVRGMDLDALVQRSYTDNLPEPRSRKAPSKQVGAKSKWAQYAAEDGIHYRCPHKKCARDFARPAALGRHHASEHGTCHVHPASRKKDGAPSNRLESVS